MCRKCEKNVQFTISTLHSLSESEVNFMFNEFIPMNGLIIRKKILYIIGILMV